MVFNLCVSQMYCVNNILLLNWRNFLGKCTWEIKTIKAHLHDKVKSFLNLKPIFHFSLKFDPSSS